MLSAVVDCEDDCENNNDEPVECVGNILEKKVDSILDEDKLVPGKTDWELTTVGDDSVDDASEVNVADSVWKKITPV